MTERGRGDVDRSSSHLRIGGSSLELRGDAIEVEVDEVACPIPSRVRGRVTIAPEISTSHEMILDDHGDHRWMPIAPRARVTVQFDKPFSSWSGLGYLDTNWGSTSLEETFSQWSWYRAPFGDGALVLYDAIRRSGTRFQTGLRVDAAGSVHEFEPPPPRELRATRWRVPRSIPAEAEPRVVRTLTDAPFYARSVVQSTLLGQRVSGVHEALVLDRFRHPLVKLMLPFRMPRNARADVRPRALR